MTQTERLLDFLTYNDDVSSLDIIRGLGIVNTTGRISDLRSQGHVIEARKVGKVWRYRLVQEAQLEFDLNGEGDTAFNGAFNRW